MEHDTRGGIRMDSRYISWERLDHFDGVLVRVHTLSELCAAISAVSALH